jgi:hypothetical protein
MPRRGSLGVLERQSSAPVILLWLASTTNQDQRRPQTVMVYERRVRPVVPSRASSLLGLCQSPFRQRACDGRHGSFHLA